MLTRIRLSTVVSIARSLQRQSVSANVWSTSTQRECCQRTSRYATATSPWPLPPGHNDTWLRWTSVLSFGSAALGIFAYFALRRSHCAAESPDDATAGNRRADLPDIRRSDIEQHKDASIGVWMTFRDGVYDVTEFIAGHPGGDEKILQAAGGAVDRYWHCYTVHHKADVYETLETLRIGNLHPQDVIESVPFEPPATVDSVLVNGIGVWRPVDMSIAEMKTRFKVITVTTKGDTAWTGVRLCDVLSYAGVREDDIEFVAFQGGDSNARGNPYEKSIPSATAFDPKEEVLLAFELNGEPLKDKHGAPCRLVIPGLSKSRHVKWLQRITVVASGSA